jgi:predicted CoA-substrate-specific enzyme activase
MTKVVIMDQDGRILSLAIRRTGPEHRRLANEVMAQALEQANTSLNEAIYVVATGYGRMSVPFADRQVTELTCHAKGVTSIFPNVRLAIDIGGQDSKGLKIKEGRILDFVMNDKCAAGTGRFLDIIGKTLGLKVEDLGTISLKSTAKVRVSNICTFFAQQEIVSHLSRGVPIEDVVAGLVDALAGRVARMVERLKPEPDVVLTGGVAKNIGVAKALEEHLGCRVLIPTEPLLTGAIGAALVGKEIALKTIARGEPIGARDRRLGEVTFFR